MLPIVGAYVRHHGSSASKSRPVVVQLSPSGDDLIGTPVPVAKHHHRSPSLRIVGSCAPSDPVRGQFAARIEPANPASDKATMRRNVRMSATRSGYFATRRRRTVNELAGSAISNFGLEGANTDS